MTADAMPSLPQNRSEWLDIYPVHLSRTWTLATGESLLLRPIRHDDEEREAAFIRSLSRKSAYQRMLSAMHVTRDWIERMTHIDYRDHMAFAVTTMSDGTERFVGVGRYVVDRSTSTAEIGIVIADARQGQGLGRRLMEALLEHARDAGVREVEGYVLATNRAMRSLALSLGFDVSAEPGDATVMRIRRSLQQPEQQTH